MIIKVAYGYTEKVCRGVRYVKIGICSSGDGEIHSGPTRYYGVYHRLARHMTKVLVTETPEYGYEKRVQTGNEDNWV